MGDSQHSPYSRIGFSRTHFPSHLHTSRMDSDATVLIAGPSDQRQLADALTWTQVTGSTVTWVPFDSVASPVLMLDNGRRDRVRPAHTQDPVLFTCEDEG